MEFHLDTSNAAYRIHGYRQGAVQVNEEVLTASFILAPDRLLRDWPPHALAELLPERLETILTLAPDLVLLGTGPRQQFPAPSVAAFFYERGIGFEVMDTPAACRAYTVLAAEGRRVVAAILIPP
ncbi:MAG: Mth938-like domain-containing protein [Gammaproteobacteria bacterium]